MTDRMIKQEKRIDATTLTIIALGKSDKISEGYKAMRIKELEAKRERQIKRLVAMTN